MVMTACMFDVPQKARSAFVSQLSLVTTVPADWPSTAKDILLYTGNSLNLDQL